MHNESYHHLSEPCSPQPFINSRLHDATTCNEIGACVCFTEDLADVGVVHIGEGLKYLSPLVFGPNHEGVHRPFDVRLVVVATTGLPEYSGV